MKKLFPVVLGLTDGIITSLVFTAGLISSSGTIQLMTILKVSVGSSLIGAFSYFIAKYTELRDELIRSGKRLNPSRPMHLLKSSQGLAIVLQSTGEALLALGSGFTGAFMTTFPSDLFPGSGIVSMIFAVTILAIMGGLISRYLHGGPIRWALTFAVMGIITTVLGIFLDIV